MADTVAVTPTKVEASPAVAAKPKGKKVKAAGGAKKPKSKSTHPPTSKMVFAAIKELKDRKGSSLQAIKKYIAANYALDVEKVNFYIKKTLRDGVEDGTLVRTKGVGASGSFKLSVSEKTGTAKPKAAAKKQKAVSKSAKPKAKSAKPKATTAAAKAKKPAAKKAAKATAKAAKATGAVKAKTPKQKTTKPSKAAPKTKVPKAKKLAAPKKAAAAAKK